MNAKLNFASANSIMPVAAATRAAVIASGILWGSVSLFQSRCAPVQGLVAADRVCGPHACV